MRTLKLVLAPLVVAAVASAIACGGGNSNDNPQVPTTDLSDSGMGSMDTTMVDSGSSMTSSMTSAVDAATTTATDTTSSAMDAATTTTTDAMDAGTDAGKKGRKGGKGGKKST